VGTLIGDVYAIDPVAMTVTQRYMASQIGPIGYLAVSALVLADGLGALLVTTPCGAKSKGYVAMRSEETQRCDSIVPDYF
jgi:hypothetical protein